MWICHVGDTQTYSNFSTFTEAVLQSQVRVELAREEEDELAGCLRTENCLGGDLVRTAGCLSAGGACSLHRHEHSGIARCLLSQNGLQAVRSLDCLRASQTEISVSFSISGSELNMDWSGELTYQVILLTSDI